MRQAMVQAAASGLEFAGRVGKLGLGWWRRRNPTVDERAYLQYQSLSG